MENIREFNKVYDLVLKLLESDMRCRNDDKWLTYRVFRHFTNIYIPFEDFGKIPSFETVSRCRRKIQNKEGLFTPTDGKVVEKRCSRESFVRDWSHQ